MKIGSNILALQAQRYLERTSKAFSKALERLASGSRINRAGDDAAGLAIATGLDSEVRGLARASMNVNEAAGMFSTADGVLAEQSSLVQRMRELAMQAANGTLSSDDRTYLDNELQQLREEFDRVAEQTEFNGVKLFDGSFGTKSLQVGTLKGQSIDISFHSLLGTEVFDTGSVSTTTTTNTTNSLKGNGTFAAPLVNDSFIASGAKDVRFADFNGDGKLDALLTEGTNGVGLMLGNGDGSFQADAIKSTVADASSINTGDINGDGKMDFIVADDAHSRVYAYLGNGNGTFAVAQTITSGSMRLPDGIALGDLNGDGKLDLGYANYSSNNFTIRFGNGNGTFQAANTFTPESAFPYDIQFVDLNADTKLDMLVTDGFINRVSVYLGNGNGTFAAEKTFATNAAYASQIRTGDLNGDGKLDLVVQEAANTDVVNILLGNGDGSFQAVNAFNGGSGNGFLSYGLVVADFNGDEKLDIATADYNTTNLSLWLGNGNGTFAARSTIAALDETSALRAQDFNGDGVQDLAFVSRNGTPKDFYVLLGNTQTVTTTTTTTTTTGSVLPFDITTQAHAQDLLSVFDGALRRLEEERSNIGGQSNRLESAQNAILVTRENLSQARSQILDVDYSEETAELAKQQILEQAGISVLAQANQQMQMVLSLLNNLK